MPYQVAPWPRLAHGGLWSCSMACTSPCGAPARVPGRFYSRAAGEGRAHNEEKPHPQHTDESSAISLHGSHMMEATFIQSSIPRRPSIKHFDPEFLLACLRLSSCLTQKLVGQNFDPHTNSTGNFTRLLSAPLLKV